MTNKSWVFSAGATQARDEMNKVFADIHGERVAYRAAHNGQPNGYKPVSEAELQADKIVKEVVASLNIVPAPSKDALNAEIASLLDPDFGKKVA